MPDQTVSPSTRAAPARRERDQLAGQVAGLEPGSRTSPDFDENFADSGQVAAEQGENMVLAGQLRDQLDEVERALGQARRRHLRHVRDLRRGDRRARLEAMPAARFCIDHA